MKKIIITCLLGISFLLVGCGVGCESKPPKRAYFYEKGGYGMKYHIVVFRPASMLSHNPVACLEYEYYSSHLYVNSLGELNGNEIIWKNGQDTEMPFIDNGDIQSNITVTITKDSVTIRGFKEDAENGVYPVKKELPTDVHIS